MPQVSPWQLIRDRTAAKARAVRFIVVRVHRQWLKLRSEGAARPHARVAVDDDDAREVRGNALLVAAGWRTGPHVPWSIWGLRDQLTGAGRATAMGEVTATEVTATEVVLFTHYSKSYFHANIHCAIKQQALPEGKDTRKSIENRIRVYFDE